MEAEPRLNKAEKPARRSSGSSKGGGSRRARTTNSARSGGARSSGSRTPSSATNGAAAASAGGGGATEKAGSSDIDGSLLNGTPAAKRARTSTKDTLRPLEVSIAAGGEPSVDTAIAFARAVARHPRESYDHCAQLKAKVVEVRKALYEGPPPASKRKRGREDALASPTLFASRGKPKGGDGDDSVTGGRARSGSTTSYNFAVGGSASAPAGSPDAPVVAPASSGTSVKPLDSYLQFVRKMYYGESEMGMTGENGGMEVQLFRRTTLGVLTNPVRPRSVMDRWTPYEVAVFEAAMCCHGKQFHKVAKCIGSKSVREVIEFYYVWKTGSHYATWKETYKPIAE